MRVLDIVAGTSVDGPGLRTSIYLAGCDHACRGCHNPESWGHDSGHEMSVDEVMEVVRDNDFNVTFSGGDPLYQAEAVTELARAVKSAGYTLWCYTGFTYEQIAVQPRFAPLMSLVDVLVDGPFVEELRDTSLLFRGSSNQRLIDLNATRQSGKPVIWSYPTE
ncbi:anaerobic ribonucleoside-triphosphate reductase activating protein [uncultured Muribaculum sp.]|uniref:anaerobic ribonucleoside-triphosphate reductase activating protein n=1 Tax=uncultured Muribaculum sp. TaxID=1918613 RepID=UPI0025EB5414|nr:anaerobic ribonucleoside-triphosphate reductase activating protein [uncultured Muribaculum sp.]